MATPEVLFSAGSETRTRTTLQPQVFETSASTIPPFPPLYLVVPLLKCGRKFRKVFANTQQIPFF